MHKSLLLPLLVLVICTKHELGNIKTRILSNKIFTFSVFCFTINNRVRSTVNKFVSKTNYFNLKNNVTNIKINVTK